MNPVVALPRRWWDARSVAFRKVTRTLVLLLLTGAVSLLVGLSTATASSPVGPHEAQWSTTLNSRLTLDLGPLGTISHASPAGPFGVDVVIGADTTIHPGTVLRGATNIASNCEIGPSATLIDAEVGERAVVPTAWVGGGAVAADTIVEPYSTIGTTIRAPRA